MEEILSQIPILLHFPLEILFTISCCSRRHHNLVQETIQMIDPIIWQKGIQRLWIRCHQISDDLHHLTSRNKVSSGGHGPPSRTFVP